MKEIKLTIDGKEVKLTDEQLMTLGIEIEEKRKNPFERVTDGDPYYYIAIDSYIHSVHENYDPCNYDAYYSVNYFNDKDFANQVALHQLLYRKLLKFAYDNGLEDNEWNDQNGHWYIFYSYADECFDYIRNDGFKSQSVYFSSQEGASRAIKEVVEPFMKEHPEFVW